MTNHEARALAKRYVAQFLANGYTEEHAAKEVCMGKGGPDQMGYEIRHGKIECPPFSGNVFNFTDLAIELRREDEQPELF